MILGQPLSPDRDPPHAHTPPPPPPPPHAGGAARLWSCCTASGPASRPGPRPCPASPPATPFSPSTFRATAAPPAPPSHPAPLRGTAATAATSGGGRRGCGWTGPVWGRPGTRRRRRRRRAWSWQRSTSSGRSRVGGPSYAPRCERSGGTGVSAVVGLIECGRQERRKGRQLLLSRSP
jgi:hypothetical protein